jgi:glycosyltransferase involved in cell wall biosynthesis
VAEEVEWIGRFSGMHGIVVSPASLGEGGQGVAARDMVDGLFRNGCDTGFIGEPRSTRLTRLASRRGLRRWSRLIRSAERREVMSRVPATGWDLAYAMPGYLPRGAGARVLHQATRHPLVVLEAVKRARRDGALGRGFMTRGEAQALCRELRRADLVRCESAAVADELVAEGIPPDRVVHAPPGVDLDRFRPSEKPDELTVAFIGPLALWKGLDVVAGLAQCMARTARFVFVGGPVDRWSRRQLELLDVERATDVPTVLARAHALVLPSVADGFGYVVLEALASGCVPLVSPMVGAAEVARELDERLVINREAFVETAAVLLPTLRDLAGDARQLAERYDRSVMAPRAAVAILDRLGLPAS